MDFNANEKLLNALVALGSHYTVQAQEIFYSELLKSTLFMAQDPQSPKTPILLVSEADEVILPVFTDLQRLQAVFPDAAGYSPVPLPVICQMALQNQIYIINLNPEQGPGGYLDRDEIEALARNRMPALESSEKPTWDDPNLVPMGDPSLPSEAVLNEMVATAVALLEKEPNVEAGYVILLGPEEGKSALTIALHFWASASDKKKSDLTRQLVTAVEAVINQPLRVVWLEGEQLKAVASRVPPFYVKDKA